MSFQKAALSLKSKLHISDLKTSTLALAMLLAVAGICTLVAAVVHVISAQAFAIHSPDDAQAVITEQIEFSDQAQVTGEGEALEQSRIVVYVSGSVLRPGVYELEEGSRVAEAILLAGGGTEEALLESINLARVLFDGEHVHVPSSLDSSTKVAPTASSSSGAPSLSKQPININTANVEQLVTLSGVGEATAQKIIADREANGPFASKEDIMRVTGIGEKKYEAIKDLICV